MENHIEKDGFKVWMFKGTPILFPKDWTIDDIIAFGKTDRICPICGEKEIPLHHFTSHLK